MEYNNSSQENLSHTTGFDVRDLFLIYKKKWYWIAISLIICLLAAFILINKMQPKYKAEATILVRTDKSANLYSQLTLLEGYGYTYVNKEVDDEISIISSTSLMSKAIKALNIEAAYSLKSRSAAFKELYKYEPIELVITEALAGWAFNVEIKRNENDYQLELRAGKQKQKIIVENFDSPISTMVGELKFIEKWPLEKNDIYRVEFIDAQYRASQYIKKMKAAGKGRRANIINLAITTGNPEKSKELLDKVIELYYLEAVTEKNETSLQAIKDIDMRVQQVNNELSATENKIKALSREGKSSSAEQEISVLNRLYQSQKNTYHFLMEKREENELLLVTNFPEAKTLNYARAYYSPVSPRKTITLMVAFLVGFFIPVILLYLINFFSNKVKNGKDFVRFLSVPVLGNVKPLKKEKISLQSFQYIRSNLQYLLMQKKSPVVQVSSSLEGEGKMTVALNLALSFASINKKTVLIDADTIHPKLSQRLNLSSSQGLADYLKDDSLPLKNVLSPSSLDSNLFVITSGDFGADTAELITSARLDELIQELRNSFDYIIIISSPVSVVADAMELNRIADGNLYVVRQDFTTYDMIPFINHIYKNKQLNNMRAVINDAD